MGTEKATNVSNIVGDDEIDEEPGEVVESAPPLKVGEERVLNHTSGLKKKLIKRGIGLESPEFGDEVTIHYVGTLLDGTKFDSSRDSDRDGPFNLKLGHGNVAIGLDHGIITMKKGEIALFTLPPELGYGSVGRRGIPPDSNIQFEVELISWITVVDVCNDGGIIKKILEKGEHIEQPGDLDEVLVKYQVMLADGTIVEKTPEEGTEFYVKDGHFCAALPKAIKTMRREEKVKLLVQPQCVFPPCKQPPHRRQLDALLADTRIDRSVAHLLGYTQLNSRLRQTGSYTPQKKKVIVVDSTVSDESDCDSDSGSEYDPVADMSHVGDGTVLSELDVIRGKRKVLNESKKARLGKGGSGGKEKATVPSVSPCVTGDETASIPAPPLARKSTAAVRARVARTPASYDVDRCARWEAPPTVGGVVADGLPLLPRPCNAQGFGLIGVPPQYAYEVVAPHMTFGGDVEKVQSESMEDSFGYMLENSAELMARLSLYSRSMVEGKRQMDARYEESQARYHESQAEISRMQGVIDGGVARQNQLVQDALAAYDKGLKDGSVDGWHEAVRAYREAGYLDPSVVDSVPCHLGISDEDVDPMEGDGACGSGVGGAPGDGMLP